MTNMHCSDPSAMGDIGAPLVVSVSQTYVCDVSWIFTLCSLVNRNVYYGETDLILSNSHNYVISCFNLHLYSEIKQPNDAEEDAMNFLVYHPL